ncbi:MAG: hypothetical protein GYB31_14370 [Bacteroidetes bacterium]|nr:hypothetical protein [Bacteroidota bacterium]
MAILKGRIRKSGEIERIEESSAGWSDIENLDKLMRFPWSGVVQDPKSKKLHFLTDRLGFSLFFIYEKDGEIAWSRNLQELVLLPGLSLTIDKEAVEAFLELGFLPGDMTWFEEISVLPAASRWVYDPADKNWQKNRYWTWEEMPVNEIEFEDAVDVLADKFRDMMAACLERVGAGQAGVSLSGGLDSRLLLELVRQDRPTVAYTFGIPTSRDVQIARQVTQRAGVPHTVLEINAQNWRNNREEAVWRSGGLSGYMHLHHAVNEPENARLADFNLNGFFGGNFFQGLYKVKNNRVNLVEAARILGKFAGRFSPNDTFYGNRQSDAYWIDQRRKQTYSAVLAWNKSLPQFVPLADYELLSFLYSLDAAFRRNNRLVTACLLQRFPFLFEDIPWQRTGLPLGKERLTRLFLKYRVPQIKKRLGLAKDYLYTDYPAWMRREENRNYVSKLIDKRTSPLIKEYAPYLKAYHFEPLLTNKRDGEEKLSRAMTLSIWFRRLEKEGVL